MTFETIPAWTIDHSDERSRYTIAAAIMLAGFSGKWVRLTADSQRLLFGIAMFGKCEMFFENDGIRASRSVCFGTDGAGIYLKWEDVEQYMAKGAKPCW